MKFLVEILLLTVTVVFAIDSTTPYKKHIPLDQCDRVCKGIFIILPISRVSLVDRRHNEPNPTLLSHCEADCKRRVTFEELYDGIFDEYHETMQHDITTCENVTVRFLKAVGVKFEKEDVVTVCDDLVHKKDWEKSWLRSLLILAAKDPDHFWDKTIEVKKITKFLQKPVNRHLELCKEHVYAVFKIIYSRNPKLSEIRWHARDLPSKMAENKDCIPILEGYKNNLHKAFKFKLGYAEIIFRTVYNRQPSKGERKNIKKFLINDGTNKKWYSAILDFVISMLPNKRVAFKEPEDTCPPQPDVHIRVKSTTCHVMMNRPECYKRRSEIRLNGGQNLVPSGAFGHVCVAFNKIIKDNKEQWDKNMVVIDTMHDEYPGKSLRTWTDMLPNQSIVACVIQGEGGRNSALLMEALEPFGADYTEVSYQEPWVFLGYKDNSELSMGMKKNGWLPWITTMKSQQGTGPVEMEMIFNSNTLTMCDTEFTCNRKPDGVYANNEQKSPKCYYMMCIDKQKFCTPCPISEGKMMYFDSTTKQCVHHKDH